MTRKFISPISIMVSKRKKFILNLNNYRNLHYRLLNKAKIDYKRFMSEQILAFNGRLNRCCIVYTVYQPSKRRFDVGNICSVHQKFFEDALVELGRLEDDKYNCIPLSLFCFGGIDPANPRVDIEVIDMDSKDVTFLNKHIDKITKRVYSDNNK